jgi:TetR/AcrR family transcriptional regulator
MPRAPDLTTPLPDVPKRTRRKDARPGELLEAALSLFIEKGYAATRAEEVARLAGVSKGTLFLYFESKEELFKAVVRENLSGYFSAWNAEFEAFEGNSADMVKEAMTQWWLRVGSTQAGGLSKLMMSEASNFPELAAFYQQEVMQPGHDLLRRILMRGIERGEFRNMDLQYGVYTMLAPMMFLATWMHSLGKTCTAGATFNPLEYLMTQADNILYGLSVRPETDTKKVNR